MTTRTRNTVLKTSARLLAAVLFGCAAPSSVRAAIPGVKATVNIALVLNETVGGHYITDKRVAELEAAGGGISYLNPTNPYGFDPDTAAANNYTTRMTITRKNFGTKAEPILLPIKKVLEASCIIKSTRYTSAEFIGDLILIGGVLDETLSDSWTATELAGKVKGYSLVSIGFKKPKLLYHRLFYFVEKKGKPPVFVGFDLTPETTPDIPIYFCLTPRHEARTLSLKSDENYRQVRDPSSGEFVESFVSGTATGTETFKEHAYLAILNEHSELRCLSAIGRITGVRKLNAANELLINGPASFANVSGTRFYAENDDLHALRTQLEGSVTLGQEVLVKDLTPYYQAIPSDLQPDLSSE